MSAPGPVSVVSVRRGVRKLSEPVEGCTQLYKRVGKFGHGDMLKALARYGTVWNQDEGNDSSDSSDGSDDSID